jgi:hypothetical protein
MLPQLLSLFAAEVSVLPYLPQMPAVVRVHSLPRALLTSCFGLSLFVLRLCVCMYVQVSQLWKEVVTRVGKEYPEVELSHM